MKINFITLCKTLIISIFCIINSFGQDTDDAYNYSSMYRNSPGANHQGQSHSVDLFTGKINVNIPLYQFIGREMDLPLSLSYLTDGVRVEEIAGSAGLGWDLNFGGRVTRIINRAPDGPCHYCLYQDDKDIYLVNAPGLTEYYLMEGYTPRPMVNPLNHALNRLGDSDWVITAVDGTRYYFGKEETQDITETATTTKLNVTPIETETVVMSWLLTKIVSSNGLDTYRFVYKNYNWLDQLPNNGEGYSIQNSVNVVTTFPGNTSYKTNQQIIASIYHNDKLIIDFKHKNREDLLFSNGTPEGNAIDEVIFYRYNGESDVPSTRKPFRKIQFKHGYFGNQDPGTSFNFMEKKLKLQELVFYGFNDANPLGVEGDKYTFNYKNPDNIQPITSFAQDHQGLYNGRTNSGLIPSRNGLERSYGFESSITGILDNIIYPGGGCTVFEYEQNYRNGTFAHGEVPATTQEVIIKQNLSVIDFTSECSALPLQYSTYHESMENIVTDNFQTNSTNAPSTGTMGVRTQLLRLSEITTVNIETSGQGVFLLQKLGDCILPDTDILCSNGQPIIPASFINSCMTNADQLFLTGDGPANSSSPSQYVSGGLTGPDYGIYQPAIELPNLPAGNYQLTLWQYDTNGAIAPPKLRIYKNVLTQMPVAGYFNHQDIKSQPEDGFRIRSVTTYTGIPIPENFAQKKEYKYAEGQLYRKPHHQTYGCGSQFGNCGYKMASIGYATQNVMYYNNVHEVSVDKNNEVLNGYISYKFDRDLTIGITYSTVDGEALIAENGISNMTDFEKMFGATFLPTTYNDNKIKETKIFDNNGKILRFSKFFYTNKEYETFHYAQYNLPWFGQEIYDPPITQMVWFPYLSHQTNTEYFGAESVTTTTNYNYFDSFICIGSSTVDQDNSVIKSSDREYVEYYDGPHRSLKVETTQDLKGKVKFTYSDILPSRPMVTRVESAKLGEPLETSILYEYDPDGNRVTTIAYTPGTITPASKETVLYGYGGRFPVAVIKGITYSEINTANASLVNDIKTYSEQAVTPSSQAALLGKLQQLRQAYPNHFITTSTYDPVYGVTSTTDEKGATLVFEYDAFGRLEFTKKKHPVTGELFIVSQNSINTRPQ